MLFHLKLKQTKLETFLIRLIRTKENPVGKNHRITQFSIIISITAIFQVITACDRSMKINDNEMLLKASSLPLNSRYDLYMKVYKSRIPRNPLLAEEIVKLGLPARDYALKKAASGTSVDFGAALTIVSKFNIPCTSKEYDYLIRLCNIKFDNLSQKKANMSRVQSACQMSPVKKWR